MDTNPPRPGERLIIEGASKDFTLHSQGGIRLSVFEGVDLALCAGECLVLTGPSGSGKSSLLRMIYGNYRCSRGRILLRHRGEFVDVATAAPRQILDMRRWTLGYVSQFLRVIPRVAAVDVVSEPLRARGVPAEEATARAEALLARLNIPPRLWALAPATFSGGEQQRINLARCFAIDYSVLLLDEPTASLDAGNRQVVIELIREAKVRGTAVLGIFHDRETRQAVADRVLDLGEVRGREMSAAAG